MSRFLLLVVTLFYGLNSHAVRATSMALEATSLKLVYSDISQSGTVKLYGCGQCKVSTYSFSSPPAVLKKGKAVPFSFFITDYWNAKYPTILVDMNTSNVLQITY